MGASSNGQYPARLSRHRHGSRWITHAPLQNRLLQSIVPEAQEPAEKSGDKASDIYENVPVLGDLDQAEFDRLMFAITEWVSPEEGCAYCHSDENLADDTKYTKVVARRMLQMTKTINTQWGDRMHNPPVLPVIPVTVANLFLPKSGPSIQVRVRPAAWRPAVWARIWPARKLA